MEELKRIDKTRIKEGVCFSKPVFFDDTENMFLAANHPVKKYHLYALSRWNVPFLYSAGVEVDPAEIAAREAKKAAALAASSAAKASAASLKPAAPTYEHVDLASIGSDSDDIEELEELEELEEVGELEEL